MVQTRAHLFHTEASKRACPGCRQIISGPSVGNAELCGTKDPFHEGVACIIQDSEQLFSGQAAPKSRHVFQAEQIGFQRLKRAQHARER